MATYSLAIASGSTNGKGVKVSGTASGSAVTLHTAVSGTSSIDEVTIWAVNTDTQTRTLTIGFGGTTSPDNLIAVPIPANAGLVLVLDKMALQNSLVVNAWADAANVVVCYPQVYRVA